MRVRFLRVDPEDMFSSDRFEQDDLLFTLIHKGNGTTWIRFGKLESNIIGRKEAKADRQ